MTATLMAVDVGNSRIKFGRFCAAPLPSQLDQPSNPETELIPAREPSGRSEAVWPACTDFVAVPLAAPFPWSTLASWPGGLANEIVIAGSNPAVVEQTALAWKAKTGRDALRLRDRQALPLTVTVAAPERVGLDRLLNAVAVNALRPVDRPAIVIDSGTATTVDLVTAAGEFAGGAILPGFALSAEALHRYTALLPQLGLTDLGPEVPAALGRETIAALRSGIFWGQVGAVRELVARLSEAVGRPSANVTRTDASSSSPSAASRTEPWLVLTGGGAAWLGRSFPGVWQVPSLAMHGLVLTAWAMTRGIARNPGPAESVSACGDVPLSAMDSAGEGDRP